MTTESINLDFYIDQRLQAWASWSYRVLTGGLGFPSKSCIATLIETGGVMVQKSARHNFTHEASPEVEEVEEALNELARYRPQLAAMLVLRYTYARRVKEKLRALGVAYDTYKKSLQIAKAWMGAALWVGKKNRQTA